MTTYQTHARAILYRIVAHETLLRRPMAMIKTGKEMTQYTYLAKKIWRVRPLWAILLACGITLQARSEAIL